MLDMGPYYVTDLVNLLGPVASVSAAATRTRAERVVTSQPLAGTRIPVEVATHVTGTLMFAGGAAVSMTMSFDVARHKHVPIEIYGETGSLIVPDPNYFGGRIELATAVRGLARDSDPPRLRRRQLSHPRRRRHGAGDPREAAASRERRARVPRSGSHGGVPGLVGRRRRGQDRDPPRAAGAVGGGGTGLKARARERERRRSWRT